MTKAGRRLTLAKQALLESGVLEHLPLYNPTVVSTIWVGLDTEDSDIDIVCCYQKADEFIDAINKRFSNRQGYLLSQNADRVLVRFKESGFLFEIYACDTPVEQQAAYRHFKVMETLTKLGGDAFPEKIRVLKQQGLKTEPAIAKTLKLNGEPYRAVMDLYNWPEQQLKELLS